MPRKFKLTDFFRCLTENKLILYSFIVVGIIIGTLISFFYIPTYQTTAIISTPHKLNKPLISFTLTKSLIEELNKELQEKQIEQLRAKLGIKKEILKEIKNIKLENLSKGDKPRFIKLIISTKAPKNSATITKSIICYLANQKFVKDELEKERNITIKNLTILKDQIPKLTLIANKTKEKLFKSKNLFIGFNPTAPDISIAEIKKKIEFLQYELQNIENFKLINSYTEISPLSASKKAIIIICAFISSLSGIFIIFLKHCD